MTAPPREPVAWIWNGYEGTGTRSLRWSKPTQWDFVPGGISPLYAAPAPSAEPIKNRVSDGSRQFPPHRDPGRVSLPMEGNDDDKSNGGRARGMAGEGDGNHLRSGCRDGEAGRDRSGEHDAGLLHPQQHADRRGGNATRLLIDNETLRQQIAADPDDSEPSAGSVEPPAQAATDAMLDLTPVDYGTTVDDVLSARGEYDKAMAMTAPPAAQPAEPTRHPCGHLIVSDACVVCAQPAEPTATDAKCEMCDNVDYFGQRCHLHKGHAGTHHRAPAAPVKSAFQLIKGMAEKLRAVAGVVRSLDANDADAYLCEQAANNLAQFLGIYDWIPKYRNTAPATDDLVTRLNAATRPLIIYQSTDGTTTRKVLADDALRLQQLAREASIEVQRQARELDRVKVQLTSEITAALAERDALRADAERYRWLRPRLYSIDFDYSEAHATVLVFEAPVHPLGPGLALDAAIDAARAKVTP